MANHDIVASGFPSDFAGDMWAWLKEQFIFVRMFKVPPDKRSWHTKIIKAFSETNQWTNLSTLAEYNTHQHSYTYWAHETMSSNTYDISRTLIQKPRCPISSLSISTTCWFQQTDERGSVSPFLFIFLCFSFDFFLFNLPIILRCQKWQSGLGGLITQNNI